MTEPRRPIRVLLLTHRLPSLKSGIGIRVRSLLGALPADGYRLTVVALQYPREERVAELAEALGAVVERLVIVPPDDPFDMPEATEPPPRAYFSPVKAVTWRVNRAKHAIRSLTGVPVSIRYFAREYRGLTTRLDELAKTSGPYHLVDLDQLIAFLLPRSLWGAPKVASFAGIMAEILRGELRVSGARRGLRRELRAMRRYELGVARACDIAVSVSGEDAQLLTEADPRTRVMVVPNPIDPGYYAAWSPRPVEPNKLVFTGSMSYAPNVDAVAMIADELLPRLERRVPDAWFEIVGADPSPHVLRRHSAKLVVRGAVDDMREYLGTAAIVVVPLRFGGGSKMKVLEAMAMGRPVVSTSIGCEGLDVVDGEHALIADDAEGLVAAIVRLLADPRLAGRIGDAGRRLVSTKYGAGPSAGALAEAYDAAARVGAGRLATLARATRYGWQSRGIRRAP